jgi:quinol monooxygenase YgiN
MATLLAHIQIQPGKEDKWEAIMHDMVHHTFASEEGVIRYEYWKGQDPLSYYCLLSFKDKWAFYLHQMSDHHEGHDFADVLAGIKLEYVDPVEGAGGGLPRTAIRRCRRTRARRCGPRRSASRWRSRLGGVAAHEP